MYLLSQLAAFLFLTFLAGVGVGYALWRAWGEREMVAKFSAAEMQLAEYLARWESTAMQPGAEAPGPKLARVAGERDR